MFVPVLDPLAAAAVPVPELEPEPEAGREAVVTATVVAGTLVPAAEVVGTPEAEERAPDAVPVVIRLALLVMGALPERGREPEIEGTDKGRLPEAEGTADEAPLGRVSVGTERIDESCCGTAATLVRARARERTTTLVLANMVSVVSVSRKCNGDD